MSSQKSVIIGCLDLETGGLDPKTKGMSEFGVEVIRVDNVGTPKEKWMTLFTYGQLHDSGIPIDQEASEVSGIVDEDCVGMTAERDLIIKWFSKCKYLVAHNSYFDMRFLIPWIKEVDEKVAAPQKWLCSQVMIDWKKRIPHGGSTKLTYIAADLGIPYRMAHRAVTDSGLLADVVKWGDRLVPETGSALAEMIRNREAKWYRIAANGSPRSSSNILKKGGRYRAQYVDGQFVTWYTYVMDKDGSLEEEMRFLAEEVYGVPVGTLFNVIDDKPFDLDELLTRIPAKVERYNDWWMAIQAREKDWR